MGPSGCGEDARMPDVTIKSASFGGMDPEKLAKSFAHLQQPCKPEPDGVVVSPRVAGAKGWLECRELAAAGFTPEQFTADYVELDPEVNPDSSFEVSSKKQEALDAVRKWLEADNFAQVCSKFIEDASPDLRHLWLRDVVLPVFFDKYPGGKLLAVSYDDHVNSYLAFLSVLKKAQLLNSVDPDLNQKLLGIDPMSSFGLNVPAEMMWLMLSFTTILPFPESLTFVASCGHRYFLVFVTDKPVTMSQGEEQYAPIEKLMPRLLSALDSKDRKSSIIVSNKFVRPSLKHPFNRRGYSADETVLFFRAYVERLNGFLPWLCDATHFAAKDGTLDIDFAMQVYLSLYMILIMTYRIIVEQSDMLTRKMALFDVLELYAGLVNTRDQTSAWRLHLSSAFVAGVQNILENYPVPFGSDFLTTRGDFVTALGEIFSENEKIISDGIIVGRNPDGTVRVPNQGNFSFEEFCITLLRSLRNTKHGFSIKTDDYLLMHTGDFSNNLPDYVLGLWLNIVSDQSSYTLLH
jgi:hypothetical protein